MKGLDFQIGDKVVWTVGKLTCHGCFLDINKDGTYNIVSHKVGGRVRNQLMPVERSLLKLDI